MPNKFPNKIIVKIPNLPPTWNDTYGINCKSKKKMYKKPEAVRWENDAAEVIRAARGWYDWDDVCDYYQLRIDFYGSKADADAYIKLAQDTLTRTLGFDDRRIVSVYSVKHLGDYDRMIMLTMYGVDVEGADKL